MTYSPLKILIANVAVLALAAYAYRVGYDDGHTDGFWQGRTRAEMPDSATNLESDNI